MVIDHVVVVSSTLAYSDFVPLIIVAEVRFGFILCIYFLRILTKVVNLLILQDLFPFIRCQQFVIVLQHEIAFHYGNLRSGGFLKGVYHQCLLRRFHMRATLLRSDL